MAPRSARENRAAETSLLATEIAALFRGHSGLACVDALCSATALAVVLAANSREQARELAFIAGGEIAKAADQNWVKFTEPGNAKAN